MASDKKDKKVVLKRIGIGLIILIVFALVVGFGGLAYLVLVPNSELFGLVYAKNRAKTEYNIGGYSVSELKRIELSTTRYDIEVMASKNDSEIRVHITNDISGIVKKKNSGTDFKEYYDPYSKTIKLELKEMSGWINAGKSKVLMVIPSDLMTQELELKLSAKKDASANVYGIETNEETEKSKLALLDIKNSHGAVNFNNLEIEQLKIEKTSGKVYAGNNVTGTMKCADISINNAIIDFLDAGNAREVMAEEDYDINNVNFFIEKVVLNKVGRKGKLSFVRVRELVSGESAELSGGNCDVKNMYFFSIKSKDFNLTVGRLNIYTNSISEFRASKNGSFSLTGEAYSGMNIVTNKGNIKIEHSDEIASVESYSGNISLKNANREVNVINIKGNSYIAFKEDAPQYNNLSKYRCVSSARVKSGKLIIEGLNKINLNVDEGGKAKIELMFNKVIDKSVFNLGKAEFLMVTPEDEPYELNYYPSQTNTDISVGTVTKKEDKSDAEFLRYVFCEAGNNFGNVVEIRNGGKVQLYSLNIFNELKSKLKCSIGK